MKIGILALQGDFKEHSIILKKCGIIPIEVREKKDLNGIKGLIIPGGESTTIGTLMERAKLDREIKSKYNQGMAIYGTCAGAILLSNNIIGSNQKRLGILDISIKRNDYGRQIDSFESKLKIKGIGIFNGIFIRAPVIKEYNKNYTIMAELNGNPVMVRHKNLLISTFHPELTNDTRIHKYFLSMVNVK